MREQITKRPAIRQQPRPKVGANAWKVDFLLPENQTAGINCFFLNYNYKEQTKKTLTEKWQLTIDNICNEKKNTIQKTSETQWYNEPCDEGQEKGMIRQETKDKREKKEDNTTKNTKRKKQNTRDKEKRI